MREILRYLLEEFRRGDPLPITLLWLLCMAASRVLREAELARWRSARTARGA